MIVLTLSKCPAGLKGDVTKWLMEIGSGVYVGKLSARVREALWKRICEHCGSGEATMIYSAKNEQGFSFYVHNSSWKPTDLDGLIFLKKPLPVKSEKNSQNIRSEESAIRKKKTQKTATKSKKQIPKLVDISFSIVNKEMIFPVDFVAIDLETTGLKSDKDCIIELAAVKYKERKLVGSYHTLVKCEKSVPDIIVQLTGIDDELLNEQGKDLETAILEMVEFIGDDILLGHYISFDMMFLRKACSRLNIEFKQYQVIDTVTLTKGLYKGSVDNYRLATLVSHFNISDHQYHRAMPDAILAAELYSKLNEYL